MSLPADADGPHLAIPPSVLPDLATFRRPRLRPEVPLLWRTQTSIQIGDDVVVERITRSQVAWLTSLDGLQSPAVIEDSLTIPEHDARRLVRALLAAGALEDAACIPERVRWAPADQRDREAARFAALMDEHRVLDTCFAIMAERDGCRIGVRGRGPLVDELDSAITAAGMRRDDINADVVVITSPHPHVTAHVDQGAHEGIHLHLGVRGPRAIVGPLVVPGRTSCLRCAHLHRRDADSAWPLMSVQWTQAAVSAHPSSYDPVLGRLAVQHALLLVRRMVDGGAESTWADHCWEIALPDAIPQRIARPPHPLCGCRWDRS